MLNQITPVILTFNEEANIARTLGQLSWAREIVLVDSFSTDRTMEIASGFRQVKVFQRVFDTHAAQWNFAISETGISSEWILALDADYFLPLSVIEEIDGLAPNAEVGGYRMGFRLCVFGKPIRSSIYPPVTVLCRRAGMIYLQDGHTQRVRVEGAVSTLNGLGLHDDRKPIGLWIDAQKRYSRLEAQKLREAQWGDLRWSDRVRRLRIVAPFAVFMICYFWRLGFLDGLPGAFYAFQRCVAEMLIALCLIEEDLRT